MSPILRLGIFQHRTVKENLFFVLFHNYFVYLCIWNLDHNKIHIVLSLPCGNEFLPSLLSFPCPNLMTWSLVKLYQSYRLVFLMIFTKLRQLGSPNWIIDNSNLDSNKFGWQLRYESDSNNDFKSTIAISIILIYFGLKLIIFDLIKRSILVN